MRAGDGTDAIKGAVDVGHPVAQRLVHRILERLRAGFDRHHPGAEHVHAKHIRLLPLDVDRAHIDDAFEAEARAERRGGDAVHAGAGFGDNALLAHPACEQNLPEHVVHFMRAGVIELFALEIDFCSATMLGQPLGEIKRRRPADVMGQITAHLPLKLRIGLGLRVGFLQLENERHQRLGDEAAAVDAEMPALVGPGAERVWLLHGHACPTIGGVEWRAAAARAARTKTRIKSTSFSPGACSTPEETSTPGARVIRSASPTLPASSPPESMNGTLVSRSSSKFQSKALPRPPGRVASRGGNASNSKRSAIVS